MRFSEMAAPEQPSEALESGRLRSPRHGSSVPQSGGPAHTFSAGTSTSEAARVITELRSGSGGRRRLPDDARVAVVGSELQHERGVARVITSPGWTVSAFSSGEALLAAWPTEGFELVLLDTDLPGMSGIETCQELRARSAAGVIFVTAHSDLRIRLRAFDAGADDCLVRPVVAAELQRRMQAVLRRVRPPPEDDELRGPAGLALNKHTQEIRVEGTAVTLTPREFAVLRALLSHPDEVQSADDLALASWGHATLGARNFVEAHISRLRRKLARAGAPRVVETVRGSGYVIRK